MPSLRLLVASLVLSSVVWAGTARAEAPPPEIVGRVAATPGGVSLRPAGGEWGDSARNDPVASGMSLRTSTGVAYVEQHRSSIAALRKAVAALDVPALAALGIAVPALGSVVLGLALAEGRLDAATAHALGSLDELFQAEAWGEDTEAAARRDAERPTSWKGLAAGKGY